MFVGVVALSYQHHTWPQLPQTYSIQTKLPNSLNIVTIFHTDITLVLEAERPLELDLVLLVFTGLFDGLLLVEAFCTRLLDLERLLVGVFERFAFVGEIPY